MFFSPLKGMMAKIGVLHFNPERIGWIGSAIVASGSLIALIFLAQLYFETPQVVPARIRNEAPKEASSISFSLGLSEKAPTLPIPSLNEQMSFSFDPPRPIGSVDGKRILVRMKKSEESKRVELPCRLDVEFQRDQLVFSKAKSPFWIDLSLTQEGMIEGRGWIAAPDGEIDAGRFLANGQESPIQGAQEFAEGSAFRILAEGKWWGKDLFREGGGERIEIGSDLLEINPKEWLVWKNGHWGKSAQGEPTGAIARIQSLGNKGLVIEGWNEEGHVRLLFSLSASLPFKSKGEELFSAIRIRSEKQISCMLEKQCMVLKTGDWVLKNGSRWKILRKKEEREAFLNNKLVGELFVFDQIIQKQGQKMVVGKLYNLGRTQMTAIEMGVHSTKKSADKGLKGHR